MGRHASETIARLPPLPPRPDDGHKGTFGRVLVVGGSDSMIGAPVLAGTAALRMGSGLVQLAMPRGVLAAALSITPELVGLPLGRGVGSALVVAANAADAIVLGPGMGRSPDAAARVQRLIQIERPMVIDADALNILAEAPSWPRSFKARAVLTPHPGEMRRLAPLIGREDVPTDDRGRAQIAIDAARRLGQVIILKGHRTVVSDGRRVHVNDTGDSTLAKAGSGDVLSGMLGCLLGQGMERFEAAVLAVYLHGRGGEIAGRKAGRRSALARDVIDAIAACLRELEAAR